MKCPICKGKTVEQIITNGKVELVTCKCCDGTGVVGPYNNEEWMKLLDTEDFAEAIFVFMNGVSKQINGEEITNKDVIINEVIIKWLKETHE